MNGYGSMAGIQTVSASTSSFVDDQKQPLQNVQYLHVVINILMNQTVHKNNNISVKVKTYQDNKLN